METALVFVEIKGEEPRKVSLEVLSELRKLTGGGGYVLEAVVLGNLPERAKQNILVYADRLVHITDAVLDQYTSEGYSLALARYAESTKPKLIAAGATRMGRDFLPRVAVLLKTGIASDITEFLWDEESLKFIRPIYGGRVLAEVYFENRAGIVTVRPNAFPLGTPGGVAGEYVAREIGMMPTEIKSKVMDSRAAAKEKVDLTEADIIVSGGRGLKAAENFKLLEDLADAIGATVGATRSVVDAKWREQEDQVGKSGKTVSPKLYIAIGISGAIHHIMGMDTSKLILAINKDPNALIYDYADYGIAADLFEVVPVMTEELKKRLGK